MTVVAHPADQMPADRSLAAVRLRSYLRQSTVPTALAVPFMFGFSFTTGSAFLGLIALLVMLNVPVAIRAYRLAGAGHVRAAAGWVAAGLWGLALVVSLAGPTTIGVTVLLSVLPIAVAVPCVPPRGLLLMAFVGTAVVTVAGSVVLFDAAISLEELSPLVQRTLASVGITLLGGVFGLSIWQNRLVLANTTAELEDVNAELRSSEQSLEQRVRERTAELQESEQATAAARDEAIAANRRKSEFLARMSHELRTPLNAILGFSELLGDQIFGDLNDKQAEYVGDIHSSGRHLVELINDILDLSRIEAGAIVVESSEFDLGGTIDDAAQLVRERATRRGVELSVDVDDDVGTIVADERKIRQVLLNLLSNAIKFTDATGSIALVVRGGAEAVSIEVRDTGVGIPAEDLALVFEEFGQSGTGRQPGVEGTGLGLPLSRRIVDAHGGALSVDSTVGVGTTVAISLPRRPAVTSP